MWGLTLVVLLVLATVVSFFVGMPRVNNASVLLVCWGPLLLFTASTRLAYPSPNDDFWVLVFVFVGAILLSSVFTAIYLRSRLKLPIAQRVAQVKVRSALYWHVALCVLLTFYGAFQLYSSRAIISRLGGVGGIVSGGGDEFRRQQIASAVDGAQAAIGSGNVAVGLLGYVLFLGHASLFTGAILWIHGYRYISVLPIVISAAYSVFTVQRSSFVMSLLLFVATTLALRRTRYVDVVKTTRSGIAPSVVLAVVGAVAIFVPLQLRNTGTANATGIESLIQYLGSGFLGLSSRTLYNPNWEPPPGLGLSSGGPPVGYGAYTFKNFFSLLQRFGMPVPEAPRTYDYYVVQLFDERYYTNVGTSILDLRYDFGLPGLAVFSLAVGAASTLAYARSIGRRSYLAPVTGLALSWMAWSFFGNSLLNDFRYILAVVAGSLILRALIRPSAKNEERPGDRVQLGDPTVVFGRVG
ncbi:O-antigen polymerase [Actinomycetospora sp. C-140]